MEKSDILPIDLLRELGYKLKKDNNCYRTNALYRGGDNNTALTIYNNGCTDWVTGESFSLLELIHRTLGFKTKDETQQWLKTRDYNVLDTFSPEDDDSSIDKLNIKRTYDAAEILKDLVPDHSYWINRGISKEVIEKFKGGVCHEGKLRNRYIIPVFNNKQRIVMLAGRDLTGKSAAKWKLLGEKDSAYFGFSTNLLEIQKRKEIILVESVGDGLSLSEAGINHWLCIFGISLSTHQLNTLIKLNLNKIIISFNNDIHKNSRGNEAATKLYRRLCKYFEKRQIKIVLPENENDWNSVLTKFGKEDILRQLK